MPWDMLFGQEVRSGTRDEIIVFWTDGDEKRAIVDAGYADARAALKRILRKFDGGPAQYDNLRATVSALAEPGRVIVARFGPHSVGLMRPYLYGDAGDEPYVLCLGPAHQPTKPVLCGSYGEAQDFAKQAIRDAELPRDGWCAFKGERLRTPFERLFVQRTDGQVILRSELEEALSTVRRQERGQRTRRANQQRRKDQGRSRRVSRPSAKRPSQHRA